MYQSSCNIYSIQSITCLTTPCSSSGLTLNLGLKIAPDPVLELIVNSIPSMIDGNPRTNSLSFITGFLFTLVILPVGSTFTSYSLP